MLAKLIALVIVSLPVAWPGVFLYREARRRGGVAWTVAKAALVAVGVLAAAFLSPFGPDVPEHDRTVFFIGAWGILFMAIGGVAIGAGLVVEFVKRRRRAR